MMEVTQAQFYAKLREDTREIRPDYDSGSDFTAWKVVRTGEIIGETRPVGPGKCDRYFLMQEAP